jgi:hypothetical protein
MDAIKTFVLSAILSHTILARHVIRTMLLSAGSAKNNWPKHLQVWSQHSEMFVERASASIWCSSLVTRHWLVDIHAAEPAEKENACHVLSLSVLQKWIQLLLLKKIKTTSVTFAIAQALVKSPVSILNVVIFITLAVWKTRLRSNTMALVSSLTTSIALSAKQGCQLPTTLNSKLWSKRMKISKK